MTNLTKFRVQAGALLFEMEGDEEFVRQQMEQHHEHIEVILSEQVKMIKSGKVPVAVTGRGRRGRPAQRRPRAEGEAGRRPGRQPVIIRESSLELKPRSQAKLDKFLSTITDGGQLGKDATVFAIAYFLCIEVLKKDTFTAGDIAAALAQLGEKPYLPSIESIDVVQMLRNLAAASIGKEWVTRNADGTFSLTEKGKEIGESGGIVRPRGRRPASEKTEEEGGAPEGTRKTQSARGRKAAAQTDKTEPRRRGRPRKIAANG